MPWQTQNVICAFAMANALWTMHFQWFMHTKKLHMPWVTHTVILCICHGLYNSLCTFKFAYPMAYAKRDFMHLPWFMHWFMHIQICISHGLCTHKKKAEKKISGGGDFDEDCNMHLHKPWVMHQKRILKKPCKNCLYLPWQIQIQNTHAWTMVNANWKKLHLPWETQIHDFLYLPW